ncbi:MAG: sugar nucleotide-binding protein [Proteobacteria bacterium]|nr:sugar nucleotide-binding protein [Pseudomonadota bacterium]
MRVLVTGGDGQLARALTRAPPQKIELWAPNRAELDICDTTKLASQLDDFHPDLIINTAAWTNVDRAEQQPDKANQVNAAAVGSLATLCAERDIRIIHLSTDYVFPGTGNEPHKPNDPTQPVNQYGKSKREGEELLLASGADCLIIRTGWLYAPWGHNFLASMRKLMVEKQILEIVSDQTGTPTSVLDLAPVIWQLAREKDPGKDPGTDHALDQLRNCHLVRVRLCDTQSADGQRPAGVSTGAGKNQLDGLRGTARRHRPPAPLQRARCDGKLSKARQNGRRLA